MCERFDITRQAHYQQLKHEKKCAKEQEKLRLKCKEIRILHPKMSGRKLHVKLGDWFSESDLKIGRDALYRALQNFGMQLRRKKGRKRTTGFGAFLAQIPGFGQRFCPDRY